MLSECHGFKILLLKFIFNFSVSRLNVSIEKTNKFFGNHRHFTKSIQFGLLGAFASNVIWQIV